MYLLEQQGTFLQIRDTSLEYLLPTNPSKRGKVTDYSRDSRKRAINLLSRLDPDGCQSKFLTLTYSGVPAHDRAKRDLQTFIKRLRRRFPQMSAFWRAELQKRGAAHFHLIIFNMGWIFQRILRAMWMAVTGEDKSGVFIKQLHGKRQVMYYVSKYVAKIEKAGVPVTDDTLLVKGSYLTATPKWEGRHWGVINRENLPFAAHNVVSFASDSVAGDLRCGIWLLSHGRAGQSPFSQTLYSDKASEIFLSALGCLAKRYGADEVGESVPDYIPRPEKKKLGKALEPVHPPVFARGNVSMAMSEAAQARTPLTQGARQAKTAKRLYPTYLRVQPLSATRRAIERYYLTPPNITAYTDLSVQLYSPQRVGVRDGNEGRGAVSSGN